MRINFAGLEAWERQSLREFLNDRDLAGRLELHTGQPPVDLIIPVRHFPLSLRD